MGDFLKIGSLEGGISISDDSWIFATEEKNLEENGLNAFSLEGKNILLVKKGAEIYALLNRCAHMECKLSGGSLEGYILKCPCHYWRYDIRTGEFIDAREIKVPIFDLKLEDGKIFIKIEDDGK